MGVHGKFYFYIFNQTVGYGEEFILVAYLIFISFNLHHTENDEIQITRIGPRTMKIGIIILSCNIHQNCVILVQILQGNLIKYGEYLPMQRDMSANLNESSDYL